MDCGGFDKNSSANLYGFMTYAPEYSVLVIWVNEMGYEIDEQIKLLFTIKCWFCVVVTHNDLATDEDRKLIFEKVD